MNKWIQLSIIAILSVIVLGACGNNETGNENKEEANESENKYTIGVTKLLEHPSLDNAYEGFQETIEEAGLEGEYEYKNAKKENKEEANESENTYTIGVTQLLEHPSLDNAYEGFQEAIEEAGLDVEYDYQNAQNDQNNVKPIADNFVADNVDLIFANSTPSALG